MKCEKNQIRQTHHGDLDITYREITVRKTTYHITSSFLGTINLRQTLEHLAISRVLADLEIQTKAVLLEKQD